MRLPLYFLSTMTYFWVPILVMGALQWRGMDRTTKLAFLLTVLAFVPVTAGMEYICLHLDIWSFSQELDPLLGVRVFGAPVEEFLFWFGGAPFVLLIYLGFSRRLGAR